MTTLPLSETVSMIALHLAFPFLPAKGHQLLRHFGSAQAILSASPEKIRKVFPNQDSILQTLGKILAEDQVAKAERAAAEMGVTILPYGHPDYPKNLEALVDPPLALYCLGDISYFTEPSLAIVGTRTCTLYGKTSAEDFARMCGQHEIPVVSGLARGIDTAAHIGALEYGSTMAVIGSGLAHIYPKENKSLAERIARNGVVCSEYPLFTPPDRFQFPRRNRLIAALAHAALLIEAPIKSGAMGTLEWGSHLGKPCFALPGRIDAESFQGNHQLIKTGKAKLVENAAEMISLLRPGSFGQEKKVHVGVALTPAEEQLLLLFPQNEISFDELAQASQLPVAHLNALLMGLSIKNIIRVHPGKLFKKVS